MLTENLIPIIIAAAFFVMGFVVRASFEQWVIRKLERELDSSKCGQNRDNNNTPDPLPVGHVESD